MEIINIKLKTIKKQKYWSRKNVKINIDQELSLKCWKPLEKLKTPENIEKLLKIIKKLMNSQEKIENPCKNLKPQENWKSVEKSLKKILKNSLK